VETNRITFSYVCSLCTLRSSYKLEGGSRKL